MRNSAQNPARLVRMAADIASEGNRIGESIATAIALSAMLATITPYPKATITSGARMSAPISAVTICEADCIPRTYIHSSGEA